MYRATIQIEKLTPSFLITFNIVMEGDPVEEVRNQQMRRSTTVDRPVEKYSSHGYTIFKMTPHPYLTIDIASRMDRRQNGYDRNSRVSFNRRCVYILQRALHSLLDNYKLHHADWYKKDANGNITTPTYEQDKYQVTIPTRSGSVVKILPAPVPIDQNGNPGEGFIFCINGMNNYSCLTVEDLGYFSYIIDHLDMTALATQLLSAEHIFCGDENLTNHVIHNVQYANDNEPIHEAPTAMNRPQNVIPEI